MLPTFLGVDAGGSSTHAALINAHGSVLNAVEGRAGNPFINGLAECAKVISNLLIQLADFAKTNGLSSPSVATITLSGGDEPALVSEFRNCVSAILGSHVSFKLEVCHDSFAPAGLAIPSYTALQQQHANRPLICVLIAGTGSVASCFSVIPSQGSHDTLTDGCSAIGGRCYSLICESRVGGRGPLVGDAGSAFAIVTTTLREALYIYDGLRKGDLEHNHAHQILTSALEAFRVSILPGPLRECDVAALIRVLHDPKTTRTEIAALAIVFARLAHSGNEIAVGGFQKAGDDLAVLVRGAIDKVTNASFQSVRVVAIGGVFQELRLVKEFRDAFFTQLDEIRPCLLGLDIVSEYCTVRGNDSPLSGCAQTFSRPGAVGAARIGAFINGYDTDEWSRAVASCVQAIRATGD